MTGTAAVAVSAFVPALPDEVMTATEVIQREEIFYLQHPPTHEQLMFEYLEAVEKIVRKHLYFDPFMDQPTFKVTATEMLEKMRTANDSPRRS